MASQFKHAQRVYVYIDVNEHKWLERSGIWPEFVFVSIHMEYRTYNIEKKEKKSD